VRRANGADLPAMIDLARRSPTAADWSRQQYEALFATGDRGGPERLALIAQDEVIEDESGLQSDRLTGATLNGATLGRATPSTLGFLLARRIDSEWELENIVVAESYRRQGVGKSLLTELLARATGSAVFLEVRESNESARALYRKMGFEEAGLRKNYYTGPGENAVLYRFTVSSEL